MTVSGGPVTLANVVLIDLGGGSYQLKRDTSVSTPSAGTVAAYSAAIAANPQVIQLCAWYSRGRPAPQPTTRGSGGVSTTFKENGTVVYFNTATLDASRAWALPNGGTWS